MTILENKRIKVAIKNKGAELASIFNKITQTEHLWPGDPNVWASQAPNLFPVVGGCNNNTIKVDGKLYPLNRHGFARNSEFILVEADAESAKFSLHYNVATLAVYPFKFEFQILYSISDNVLRIEYKVINHDEQTIWFSMGAHPAFNIPFDKNESTEDYFIEFEFSEKLERHTLSENGLYDGKTEIIAENAKTIPLNNTLFDKDALVFKDLKSRKVSLKSKNHDKRIELNYPQFPYLGIWSKPRDAKFVCLEPWLGYADNEGQTVELKNKEAIQKVDKGHVFDAAYTIGVY
jgi:galactose mutarotase-like enzyme